MRRKTIFYKMVIGALLLSILSGCGKKAGVDYIQENDSRQDAVSASDLHLNYSVSNGRTTVNVDADVNTSLSTQSAPVATAVRCDYTNEDITRIAAAIFDEGSYKLFLPYSRQSKENITAACAAFAETFPTYADKSEIPYNLLAECSYAQNAKDGGVFDPIETNGTIQYYPTIKPSADSEEFCNFCNIRGTIDGKDCQLSFVQTRKHCMLVLHKDYNEELTYGLFNQLSPIRPDMLETLAGSDNICSYSTEGASTLVTDTLSRMGIDDYVVTDVFPTQTIRTVYDISSTYQVTANYDKEPVISYDSYLVYGGRSLDALTPVYTTANFQTELTDYAVVADMNGNTVCVFSTSGEVSSQTMQYPVCDIDVGDQGAFAVVLESEKTNYVNLYTRKGEIVYEIQTSIDKSGYPLDISISDNGEKLFTSYMNVGNMVMENTLAAYNFGEVGQNSNADRLVGSYSFSDQVFSKVQFVDNDTVVAFGTKAIEIYTMKEKPVLKKHIVFNDEIRSIFYGDDYIGVIQKNTNENTDALYTLHAYNLRGKEMFSKSLSFDYDNIFAGKDEIIVTGGNDCAIFRKNGSVKFEGELKSRIRSVVPSGKRLEYVVVYENETQVIKLKNALSEGSQRGNSNTKTKSDTPVATPANAATSGDAQ